MNIKKYYRFTDDFNRYIMQNKKRVNELEKTYKSNKKYFGKNVLDIACGGGILGFIVEKNGHKYTGIDINPDMIKGAKTYAKQVKSKNKFILIDATKRKINGKYDTITFLGNALCHFNTGDFLKLIKNINKNYHKGTYFIIDYRDMVKLLYEKIWDKDKTYTDKNLPTRPKIYTKNINTKKGEIHQEGIQNRYKFKSFHGIWSPFIIEPIMELSGWKLVKRKEMERWTGWIDVYKKVK